jgi:hypothetical protein
LEPPYSPAKLTAFFQGHASYGQIRHWRYGHCEPPPWAIERMRQEFRKRIAMMNAGIESLNNFHRHESAGKRGTRHLRAWRERKARERDEKEMAAEMAALHQTPNNDLGHGSPFTRNQIAQT